MTNMGMSPGSERRTLHEGSIAIVERLKSFLLVFDERFLPFV
jgi:hypothetical protein